MVAKLPKSQDLAAFEGFEAELRVLMTVAVNKASAPIARDETSEQAQQEARNIKEMCTSTSIPQAEFSNRMQTRRF